MAKDVSDQAETFFKSTVPFDINRVQAAAVYCSDGRFGEQCDDLLQNALKLPRYDRVAVPGGAACLASHLATEREEAGVVEQLGFLVEVHKLERVVLIAHENCAFYLKRLQISPEELKEQQLADLRKAVSRVQAISSDLTVDGFFARMDGAAAIAFDRVEL